MNSKFNFIPETQISNKSSNHELTISITKAGNLYFTPLIIDSYGIENKFIKFFVDKQNKTIGWKILDEKEPKELKGYRQVKKNDFGYSIMSVKKLLKFLEIDFKVVNLKRKKIEKYNSVLQGQIYYINL